jgi:hypothetical protein
MKYPTIDNVDRDALCLELVQMVKTMDNLKSQQVKLKTEEQTLNEVIRTRINRLTPAERHTVQGALLVEKLSPTGFSMLL